MNDQYTDSASDESTPSSAPYKDRSAGLVIFGILTVLLGCLSGLVILGMLLGQAVSAKNPAAQIPLSSLAAVMAIYGTLAVALIWLGIGSMMARRWARALLLIFSWSWLLIGCGTSVLMVFILPKTMSSNLSNLPPDPTTGHPVVVPPGVMTTTLIVVFGILGIFFIILPTLWVFFYNSRHVKATCETRDPVIRWTDACPLPVLALCLFLLFPVPVMLIMPIMGHYVTPFFGIFLSGPPATVFALVIAVIWTYSAWSLYRLEQVGWWLILISMCVYMVSGILTFMHHDFIEMYRLMNYPAAQTDRLQKSGMLTGTGMGWMMLLGWVPFFGYLLFIKRYLRVRR
jgi:hypothetical protein